MRPCEFKTKSKWFTKCLGQTWVASYTSTYCIRDTSYSALTPQRVGQESADHRSLCSIRGSRATASKQHRLKYSTLLGCHCMSAICFCLGQSFSHEDRGRRSSFKARRDKSTFFFFAPAVPANAHKNSKTALTEFSNCSSERPAALGFGRSSLPAKMTAMPQRYSHQRRRTSTAAAAAARRMERRRREQGKNNNLTSDHNSYRSKKLAMLSR